MLKIKAFLHIPSQNHPRIQEFQLYFGKRFVSPDKNGKSTPTQLAPVPGYAYGLR